MIDVISFVWISEFSFTHQSQVEPTSYVSCSINGDISVASSSAKWAFSSSLGTSCVGCWYIHLLTLGSSVCSSSLWVFLIFICSWHWVLSNLFYYISLSHCLLGLVYLQLFFLGRSLVFYFLHSWIFHDTRVLFPIVSGYYILKTFFFPLWDTIDTVTLFFGKVCCSDETPDFILSYFIHLSVWKKKIPCLWILIT